MRDTLGSAMTELRVQLSGEHAELGEVPARDVARLIIEVERALASTAYVVLGRRRRSTGRYQQTIADAVRLRLLGVERGSVVPVLELPEVADAAAFDLDAPSLGEAALSALLGAANPTNSAHPAVAAALLDVAERVYVGDRYEALAFEVRRRGQVVTRARVDGQVRRRLRDFVNSVPSEAMRADAVLGVLYEADFERNTARLRSPARQVVEVRFSDEQADDIQAALRQQATLRGEVVYDAETQMVQRVVLREVIRGEQLALPDLDPDDFWRPRTFDELAEAHGSADAVSVDAVYDADATEDEREAFMAALAELG